MSDPQTANLGLYLPSRGSDVDVWDLPENANDGATDSLFANVATISLSAGNVPLTTPPNSGAAWSGPYQSQSAILKFTGTLTGNVIVTLPRPGFFIVDNQCVVGPYSVRLGSASPGAYIGAPPGAPTQVYCDGTDVKYVNLGAVGAALDLHGVSAVPAWIAICTTFPYLLKNGAVYNISDYPALGQLLGSTFGGNGITTFGVPDERNRARIAIDPGGTTARLTAAVCNIDGSSMGAAGGSQSLAAHNHGGVTGGISSTPNINAVPGPTNLSGTVGQGGSGPVGTGSTSPVLPTHTHSIPTDGSGDSQNVQPSIISFLPLIKT